MISIKNKFFILLLLITYILPLGGIGISSINNSLSTNTNSTKDDLNIDFYSNGSENGLNIFLYFDALPNDLAIEYSREVKAETGIANIYYGLNNQELDPIEGNFLIIRKSDYLTIRKELMGLSIPILAKASLYIGGGLNKHETVVPSIELFSDLYDIDISGNYAVDDLYNAANQVWDASSLLDLLNKNTVQSTGMHIQTGVQGKLLMLNVFANARYTFIIDEEANSIASFPGLTIGMAYGF
ncbi:hypothetical protein OAI93_02160 [bacterium]|nr:hypothetical protein [bacterium]